MCSRDGYGKYHLFGCDHEARMELAYEYSPNIVTDQLEDCGGYRP